MSEEKKPGLAGMMWGFMRDRWKFSSTNSRAWLGNGMSELQQAFHPGVQQIEAASNPVVGTVTSGEKTEEKRDEKRDAKRSSKFNADVKPNTMSAVKGESPEVSKEEPEIDME